MPRSLTLNVSEIVESNDIEALVSYSISWQPPLYLGGLNLTDVQYKVTVARIGAYITNNTYFKIPLTVRVRPALLKTLRTEVRVISTQVNNMYLPANMYTKATYRKDDLIETAIGELLCETY